MTSRDSLGVQNLYLRDTLFAEPNNKLNDINPSNPATKVISDAIHQSAVGHNDADFDIEHRHPLKEKENSGYYYFAHMKPPSVAGSLKQGLRKKAEQDVKKVETEKKDSAVVTNEVQKELDLALEREKRYLVEIEGLQSRGALERNLQESDKANVIAQLKFNNENLERQLQFANSRIDELIKGQEDSRRLLDETTSYLDHSHHTNKLIMEKLTFTAQSLEEVTKEAGNISRDYDSLKLWKEVQTPKLQDYEDCFKQLHSSFSDDISAVLPKSGATLAGFISSLVESKSELQKRNKDLSKEKADLESKLAEAAETYLKNIEQTKAQLASEKERMELSSSLVSVMKSTTYADIHFVECTFDRSLRGKKQGKH
jgi:hypothetical protein